MNKLKTGQLVRLSKKRVEWEVENCPDMYVVGNTKMFRKDYWPQLAFWFNHAVNRTQPQGVVIGFGSEEDSSARRCVRVEFKDGQRRYSAYYLESDLSLVRRKG